MSVLPGSLDYLYHNGIINHIPYEAYMMAPMTPSGYAQMMGVAANPYSGLNYLEMAQSGLLYNTYNTPDMYVRHGAYPPRPQNRKFSQRIYNNEGYGRNMDMEAMINGEDGKQVRKSITNKFQNIKDRLVNGPEWAKGILGLGLIALTALGIVKGFKKPAVK